METRGWDDGRQADVPHAAQGAVATTTATSRSPTCRRCTSTAAWLEAIRDALPELPAARRARYRDDLGLSAYDAAVIVNDPTMSAAFEAIARRRADLPVKEIANLVTGDYGRHAREIAERGETGLVGHADAASLADLVRATIGGSISRTNARDVLAIHLRTGRSAREIIAQEGFAQISDTGALDVAVEAALAANPAAVADYRAGKPRPSGSSSAR